LPIPPRYSSDDRAPLSRSEFAQAAPHLGIRRPPRLVTNRLPIRFDDLARPTLAHLIDGGEMCDSLSLGGGRYH